MKNYLFVALFIALPLQAQNLDSLYQKLMGSRINIKNTQSSTHVIEMQPEKCGFGLIASIKEHFDEYSIERQQNLLKVMERRELQTSIISPSGLFRIHYDTTGSNVPLYDNLSIEEGVFEVAVAFDSSYHFFVNLLGYIEPPSDGTLGGDDKYDVYIVDYGSTLYGQTFFENDVSYIEIENSFKKSEGFNSYGINAARATAAHELHHAIQVGSYGDASKDQYYYELTSTAFEEFVYDDVNDYYAYIYSYFRNTAKKLESNKGYNLAIWNIFLQERFNSEDPLIGHKIVMKSWELIRDKGYRAIIAIANAMEDYGKSFGNEFNVFADWMYFTNDNTKAGQYFEEAVNYPSVKSTYTLELEESEKTITIQSEPTSINYLTFTDYSQGFADTIVAVLSNSDVYGSLSNNNELDVQFSISNGPFEGAKSINDTYYSKLASGSIEFIQSSYIINNELSWNEIPRKEIDFAYPQPYSYETNSVINIPTHPDLTETAELRIYSSDMNLVYSGNEKIFSNGNIVVKWNGFDDQGDQLASGIYVYVTRANGKIKKGKFVILN